MFCSWLINSCVLLISEFRYNINATMSLYSISIDIFYYINYHTMSLALVDPPTTVLLHIESDVTHQPWHKIHTHWPSFCITQVINIPWWIITSQNTVPCFYAAHSHHTAQPVFGQQWDDHCELLSRWQWSPPVHRDEQQKQRKGSHLFECER